MDYAREYGIDVDVLMMEAFSHPVAQWENARIVERGEQFWSWYRHQNPEPPREEVVVKKVRRRRPKQYTFTDAQMAIAMRSIRDSR